MLYLDRLEEKTNEELLLLYKKTLDPCVKQQIVLRYVYIVKNIAMQMRGVYLSFAQVDDIVNEGVMALMRLVDKFEPEMNVKFETYISKRIRGLIIDIARRQDWVPRSVRKVARDIDNATSELFVKLGRYPEDNEIAEHLGLKIEKYYEELAKTNIYNVVSLEMILEDNVGNQKNNKLYNSKEEYMPEQNLQNSEMEAALKKGLKTLRENEQTVISLYYIKELSMKEIAAVLNLSEPRISQIHANALKKLRVYLNEAQEPK